MKSNNIRLILIIMAIIITSCNTNTTQNISQNLIHNRINPVIIKSGENTLLMENYFIDVSVIDSVQCKIDFKLSDDKKSLKLNVGDKIPLIT